MTPERRRQGRRIRKARRNGTMGRFFLAPTTTAQPTSMADWNGWVEIGYTTDVGACGTFQFEHVVTL